MVFAVLKGDDVGYQIVYLLHILTVVAAFAGAMVNPRLGGLARRSDDGTQRSLGRFMVDGLTQMHFPALIFAGLFGIGLIMMSSDTYEFSQTWISIAFLLWLALLAVFFFALRPALAQLSENPTADDYKKAAMFNGIVHLLFLLMLIDMVFKPGL